MQKRRRGSATQAQSVRPVNAAPESFELRTPLSRRFFARDAVTVARELVGAVLFHEGADGVVAGRVVETEAYEPDDPASHSFRGPTARNAAMFGPPGHAYVYRSYGVHWCFNVSTGPAGHGAAVLVRAAEPLAGQALMAARRGLRLDDTSLTRLARGPGCLTQAFGLTRAHDGVDLTRGALLLLAGALDPGEVVRAGPRIGISQARSRPFRFFVAKSPFVSGPRRP